MPVITFRYINNGVNTYHSITRNIGATMILKAEGTPDRGEKQTGWRLTYPGTDVVKELDKPYTVDHYNDMTFTALYETIDYRIQYVSRHDFWLYSVSAGLPIKYNKYTNKVVPLPKMIDEIYHLDDWNKPKKMGVNYRWYTNSTFTNEITSLDLRDRIGDITVYMYDIPIDKSARLYMYLWYNEEDLTLNMPPPWQDYGSVSDGWEGFSHWAGNTSLQTSENKLTVDLKYTLKPGRKLNMVYGESQVSSSNLKASAPITGKVDPAQFTIEGWGRGDYYIYLDVGYISYSITYNLAGGTGAHGNPTSYYVKTNTINLVQGSMTRTGYSFDGWFTAASGGSKVTVISKGSTGNKDLYARWSTIDYTITYLLGESTAYPVEGDHGNPTSYNILSGIIYLGQGTLSRPGWTFDTWTPMTFIPGGSTRDKAFTANWSTNTYNVYNEGVSQYSYKTSDNNGSSKSITLVGGTSKVGYIFTHRELERQEDYGGRNPYMIGNSSLVIPSGSYGQIAATAIFEPIEYNIVFNPEGGTPGQLIRRVKYDDEVGDLPTGYTRVGYIFQGWFTAKTDGTELVATEDNLTTINGATLNYYAQWKAITYKIELKDFSDGTVKHTLDMTYDQVVGDVIPTSTRSGYIFDGWISSTNGSKLTTTDKNLTTVDKSSVTYVAKWIAKVLNVNYSPGVDYNGVAVPGTTSPSQGHYDGNIAIKPSNTFTLKGHSFVGWKSSDINAAEKEPIAGTTYPVNNLTSTIETTTANNVTITLTAQWTRVSYTLSFDDGGLTGSDKPVVASITDLYDEVIDIDEISYQGFTFLGWFTAKTGGARIQNSFRFDATDATLYARWQGKTYQITINSNGGELKAPIAYTTSLTEDRKLTLPSDMKKIQEGKTFTFASWQGVSMTSRDTSEIVQGQVVVPAQAYGDVEVEAKWTFAVRSVYFGNTPLANARINFGTDEVKYVYAGDKLVYQSDEVDEVPEE